MTRSSKSRPSSARRRRARRAPRSAPRGRERRATPGSPSGLSHSAWTTNSLGRSRGRSSSPPRNAGTWAACPNTSSRWKVVDEGVLVARLRPGSSGASASSPGRTGRLLTDAPRKKSTDRKDPFTLRANRGRRRLPESGAAAPGSPAGAGSHARAARGGQRPLGGLPLPDRERTGGALADGAPGDRGEPRRRGGELLPRGRQRDDAGRPRGRPACLPARAAVRRGVRRSRPAGQGLGLHRSSMRAISRAPARSRSGISARSSRSSSRAAFGSSSARRRTSSGPATGRTTPRSTATRPRSSRTSPSRRSGS